MRLDSATTICKRIVSYLQRFYENHGQEEKYNNILKQKKNLTAVRSQNNFWIIEPFYHLTILSFPFFLFLPFFFHSASCRGPYTGPCTVYWSLLAPLRMALVRPFLCFSLKRAPGPTSHSLIISTQYMFHLVLPSGVQSVYGVSSWRLPGTYYRRTRSRLRPGIFERSICPGCFL